MKTSRIREFKNFCLAALLIASATFVACSNDDNIIEEKPVQPKEKVYTMTVQATKATGDDATTRGLSLDDHTLNVHWNAGEVVEVVQYDSFFRTDDVIGTLTATPDPNDPTKATLTGELEEEIDLTEDIQFYLHSSDVDYTGQSGVLLSADGANSIEENYDYATCTVEAGSNKIKTRVVEDPDGDKEYDEYYLVTIEGGITLESEQAIVKFTLVDKADGMTPIYAKKLDVIEEGTFYSVIDVTSATATNVLYVAVGNLRIDKLKAVTATGDVYTYERTTGANLTDGKYYEIKVQMTKQAANIVDLATVGGAYTAVNGDVLTGTLGGRYKISITDGATVTLRDVTIEGYDSQSYDWAGITCEGDATIVLEGENSVRGFYYFQPGISVPSGKTLTIRGSGSLEAKSNQGTYIKTDIHGNETVHLVISGPGIGGRINEDCGNIVIESGTITATGSYQAAGIGSSEEQSCGTITITGGIVTATGGEFAAGIGNGWYSSNCGNITITGGTVTATGGKLAAGIGGGYDSDCSDITIGGSAYVTATKGEGSPYCIGLGKNGSIGEKTSGTITIGGTVYYDSSTKTWAEGCEDKLKANNFYYPAPRDLTNPDDYEGEGNPFSF